MDCCSPPHEQRSRECERLTPVALAAVVPGCIVTLRERARERPRLPVTGDQPADVLPLRHDAVAGKDDRES